jgi:hypothetical protein
MVQESFAGSSNLLQTSKTVRSKREIFFISLYFIQNCFICRSSDSTVSEDAGIEPRAVVTLTLAIRGSN